MEPCSVLLLQPRESLAQPRSRLIVPSHGLQRPRLAATENCQSGHVETRSCTMQAQGAAVLGELREDDPSGWPWSQEARPLSISESRD